MSDSSEAGPTGRSDRERSGNVQSVDRALRILEALGEDEDGARLMHLAERTRLSPSTAHRLLTTLQRRQFVQYDPTDSTWHVGRQSFLVGSTFVRHHSFASVALPYLKRLRDLTRETANLGIVDDGNVVVLSQVESRELMRAITKVGGRVPMASSGMGKAILTTFSPDEVAAKVAVQGMHRYTQHSIVRMADLRADVEQSRLRGFAVDDEEYQIGLRCIAAAVYNAQEEALCAISVSGLTVRLTADRVEPIGEIVAKVAQELTVALGGRVPAENFRS